MKFETFLLRGLFVACSAVCALVLGAMLNTGVPMMSANHAARVSTTPPHAAIDCDSPSHGTVCAS